MHSLVPAIVLRASGSVSNERDAERDPPRRQLRDAGERSRRRERRTVIRVNRFRHAVAMKQALEDGTHFLRRRVRQNAQVEHEAAERVAHRQRVAARAVAGAPPALEIDRPDIIRRFDDDVRRLGRVELRAWSSPPLAQQLRSRQNALDGRSPTAPSVHARAREDASASSRPTSDACAAPSRSRATSPASARAASSSVDAIRRRARRYRSRRTRIRRHRRRTPDGARSPDA